MKEIRLIGGGALLDAHFGFAILHILRLTKGKDNGRFVSSNSLMKSLSC